MWGPWVAAGVLFEKMCNKMIIMTISYLGGRLNLCVADSVVIYLELIYSIYIRYLECHRQVITLAGKRESKLQYTIQ